MLSTSVAVRNGGGRAKGRQSVKGKKRVIYIVTVEAIESLAFLYHQLPGINLFFSFSLENQSYEIYRPHISIKILLSQ